MILLEVGYIDVVVLCAAKELGVPQIGSFRCLNGKVDLSTYEAEHTVETLSLIHI